MEGDAPRRRPPPRRLRIPAVPALREADQHQRTLGPRPPGAQVGGRHRLVDEPCTSSPALQPSGRPATPQPVAYPRTVEGVVNMAPTGQAARLPREPPHTTPQPRKRSGWTGTPERGSNGSNGDCRGSGGKRPGRCEMSHAHNGRGESRSTIGVWAHRCPPPMAQHPLDPTQHGRESIQENRPNFDIPYPGNGNARYSRDSSSDHRDNLARVGGKNPWGTRVSWLGGVNRSETASAIGGMTRVTPVTFSNGRPPRSPRTPWPFLSPIKHFSGVLFVTHAIWANARVSERRWARTPCAPRGFHAQPLNGRCRLAGLLRKGVAIIAQICFRGFRKSKYVTRGTPDYSVTPITPRVSGPYRATFRGVLGGFI